MRIPVPGGPTTVLATDVATGPLPPADADASQGEAILQASLKLFAEKGFEGATTREIAAAVGLKQASLFHYFRSKDGILRELLDRTVRRSLHVSKQLEERVLPAAAKLWLLVFVDVREMSLSSYQSVRLMQLPHARRAEYTDFWTMRAELREHYGRLIADTLEEAGAAMPDGDLMTHMVFGMTEAPVAWCEMIADPVAVIPRETADAAVAYLLRDPVAVEAAREGALDELKELEKEAEDQNRAILVGQDSPGADEAHLRRGESIATGDRA